MPTLDRPQAGEDRKTELAIVRRAYAKHVLANADVDDARVEAAFATMRREHFLGPGPWPMLRWPRRYVPTPRAAPRNTPETQENRRCSSKPPGLCRRRGRSFSLA